jgi:Protein of unknown function (DUF3592)
MPPNIDALLLPICIFSGLFGFASPVVIALGFWSLRKVFAARNWKVALGQSIEPTPAMIEAGNGLPVVAYEYTVAGHTYQNTQVYIRLVGDKAAYAAARRYPVSVPVRLYYNPQAPSESVLERDGWTNLRVPSLLLLAGTVLFLISLVPFGVLWLAPVFGEQMVAAYLPGGTLAGIVALAGLVAIVIALAMLIRVWLAKGWYSAIGGVTLSTVHWFSDSKDSQSEHPVIVYDYMVNGRRYQGNRVYSMTPAKVEPPYDFIARYPVGKPTTIYFNPNNPADAALERPGNINLLRPLGLLVVGILLLLVSIVPVLVTYLMNNSG